MVKNLFAWASIGSNGKVVDDLAGDQNGKEVKIGEYYNFGQKWVIRFRSKKRGQKAAAATKMLARNNNIGYNQNNHNRKSLYIQCELIGWDIDKIYQIKPCDCIWKVTVTLRTYYIQFTNYCKQTQNKIQTC